MNDETQRCIEVSNEDWRKLQAALLRYFCRRGNRELADELTQETLTRFICMAKRHDHIRKHERYIWGIAKNVLIDHLNRKRRQPPSYIALEDSTAEGYGDPHTALEAAEAWQRSMILIAGFSARDRAILTAYALEGRRSLEIAAQLGHGKPVWPGRVPTRFKIMLERLAYDRDDELVCPGYTTGGIERMCASIFARRLEPANA